MKIENIFRLSSPLSNFSKACFWSELLSTHSFINEPITSFCYKADRLEISLLLDSLNCSAIFSDALLSVLLKACLFACIFICGHNGFFALLEALWGRGQSVQQARGSWLNTSSLPRRFSHEAQTHIRDPTGRSLASITVISADASAILTLCNVSHISSHGFLYRICTSRLRSLELRGLFGAMAAGCYQRQVVYNVGWRIWPDDAAVTIRGVMLIVLRTWKVFINVHLMLLQKE